MKHVGEMMVLAGCIGTAAVTLIAADDGSRGSGASEARPLVIDHHPERPVPQGELCHRREMVVIERDNDHGRPRWSSASIS